MIKINLNLEKIRGMACDIKTYNRGLDYFRSGHIKKMEMNKVYNDEMLEDILQFVASINGSDNNTYTTKIEIDSWGEILNYSCNCKASEEYLGCCKHSIAAILYIYSNYAKKYIDAPEKRTAGQSLSYKQIIQTYQDRIYNSVKKDFDSGNISLACKLIIQNSRSIGVDFFIGTNRLYVVKCASVLAINIKNSIDDQYGKNLKLNHNINNFTAASKPIAKFLVRAYDEYVKLSKTLYPNSFSYMQSGKSLIIVPSLFDEFFDLFLNKKLKCEIRNYDNDTIIFSDSDPDLSFKIEPRPDNTYAFSVNEVYNDTRFMFKTDKHTYIINDVYLCRCSDNYNDAVVPAVDALYNSVTHKIIINKDEIAQFYSTVVKQIEDFAHIHISSDIKESLISEELMPRVYLDTDNQGTITSNVIFNYGNTDINPFSENKGTGITRDVTQEIRILSFFDKYRFIKSKDMLLLNDDEAIYNFLTEGINELINLCEVNVSEDFKKINIRNPKTLSMGVKINNNLIEIDVQNLEFDIDELREILNNFKIKKKYFRLKDGSYLHLDESYFSALDKLTEDFGITDKQLKKGCINIPTYRLLYLDSIIKNNEAIRAKRSMEFKSMVHTIKDFDDNDIEVPDNLNATLRQYQINGYRWLKTLSNYSLGGILADDMGLGKTLQIITLLLSEKNTKNRQSIVICPTSLVFNWQSEIEKFAPQINSMVVTGSADRRQELLTVSKNCDLIITSYDLLKRDIELYENMHFRYCIIDEAQYIKNAYTQNATAVKLIKSQVRFALTGTPIENSLSDLWSIFDFIMPGFLLSYNKFKEKYEYPITKKNDRDILERLTKQIQPFILRRLKKDVLKELPDKIETTVYTKMDDEQKKIYTAELIKLNKQLNIELSENGLNKSQIKILAMLTRLRQLCCHPSLYLENYSGESAKLNLCMQLVRDSIDNGHKIIIFSQFTTMLDIIGKELYRQNISYYMLTGDTKSSERLTLANSFNTNDIPVFLISLKAGGTGLNLIGADIVIHYDPWWNLSAQNQATDRAHRIGQKNKVQIFKLITKDTIEEKIQKLQQRKQNMIEAVITEKEVMFSSLTAEEINNLFSIE